MSKISVKHHETIPELYRSSSFDEDASSEDPASTNDEIPESDNPQQVEDFARSYGLTPHLNILRKAHQLIHADVPPIQVPGLSQDEIVALQHETERKWRQPWTLYFTIAACSVGAVEQGWAQTSMNGANLYFPKAFGIDSDSKHDTLVVGLINSGIYLSVGFLGAWLSSPVNNRIGRRGAIFVGGVFCLVSSIGSALAQSWQILLLFRVLLGIGLGLNASTVAVFAAECTPASIRGGLAVSWQMFTAFGIFLGFVANAAVYNYGSNTWRLQLAGPLIPAVPLIFMVFACPESPAWHLKNNRYDLALRSLFRLRNTELQAAKELYLIYLQRKPDLKLIKEGNDSLIVKVSELFTIPRNRRAVMASYTVMLSQQLCGINIIAFYSSTIFSESGFSTYGALLASCVFGFVNFLGAFPAVWTMDTFGRRSLLLLTLPFMAVTMLAAGLSFAIPADNPLHFGLLATLIYLFCAEYSPGMGPVPVAYSAEIFPLSHREAGMSLAVSVANIWATILSLTFPRLLTAAGALATFSLYAFLNVVALVLIFLFVPETRLKTLDELDGVFSIPSRVFVRYQLTEWLPWFVGRYVLRREGMSMEAPPPPLLALGEGMGGGYGVLAQEEDDGEADGRGT